MKNSCWTLVLAVAAVLRLYTLVRADTHEEQQLYAEGKELLDEYSGDRSVLIKAERLFQQILKSNPNSAPAYVGLGRLAVKAGYISNNDFDPQFLKAAHGYFSRALAIDSTFFDAYYYGAYLYLNEKNYVQAKQMAKKARELAPNSLQPDLLLADIAEREKRYDEVERLVLPILGKTSDRVLLRMAHESLSSAYEFQKRYDLAEQSYLKIIELDPKSSWSLINYSSFLIRRRAYDKAIDFSKKALTLMDFGMGRHVLGKAYYKKGEELLWEKEEFEQSKTYFRLALEQDPTNADAYYGLGVAYYHTGYDNKNIADIEQAEKALAKAVQVEPNHHQAQEQLERVRKLINIVKEKSK